MADQIQRMHTPPPPTPTWKKGGAGKNMALEARFQKLREGLAVRGTEFSEGGRFLRATMFFCMCYSYHYIYSNIFDIAKSLTQNYYGPIQSYSHQMLFWYEGL